MQTKAKLQYEFPSEVNKFKKRKRIGRHKIFLKL